MTRPRVAEKFRYRMLATKEPSLEPQLTEFPLVPFWRQDHVILQVKLCLVIVLAGLEVYDKVVFHGKDGISLQPLVALWVKLGSAALIVWMRHLSTVSNHTPLRGER